MSYKSQKKKKICDVTLNKWHVENSTTDTFFSVIFNTVQCFFFLLLIFFFSFLLLFYVQSCDWRRQQQNLKCFMEGEWSVDECSQYTLEANLDIEECVTSLHRLNSWKHWIHLPTYSIFFFWKSRNSVWKQSLFPHFSTHFLSLYLLFHIL